MEESMIPGPVDHPIVQDKKFVVCALTGGRVTAQMENLNENGGANGGKCISKLVKKISVIFRLAETYMVFCML
jgi:hypothetical protein